MKKLFLLDAYALIYRAYYGLIRTPIINSKKQNTSAVFGFVKTLQEILEKENPTHIAVAFDPKGKTFRHEAYPDYKAQREETPEDIRWSVPVIKDIIKAMNIALLEVPGYEADDVIGTVAWKAAEQGFTAYMMTPDKDYGQLVRDNVYIYKPGMGKKPAEILDTQAVCNKYGIESPSQVVDILGLMGDAVDNVPGCPGVGEKTACGLLQKYSSIEEMYEDLSKVKGKLREKIEQNKEQVLFSKFLVKIDTNVPIDFDEAALERKSPDEDKLKNIYADLEFYSLLKKMGGGGEAPKKQQSKQQKDGPIQLDLFAAVPDEILGEPNEPILTAVDLSKVEYKLIEGEQESLAELRNLLTSEKFAFRIVGTSDDSISSKIGSLAICAGEGKNFFFLLGEELAATPNLHAAIKDLFENTKSLKICHDLKEQYHVLKNSGIELAGEAFDTMLAHYVLQPELNHALFSLAETYLGSGSVDKSVFDATAKPLSATTDPAAIKALAMATEAAFRLYPVMRAKLELEGVLRYYETVELPLTKVLAEMEHTGVRINEASLAETSRIFTSRMNAYEADAHQLSGEDFNLSSPKQVGEVLFDKLKLDPKAKKTKTGQYVTSEEVLESLRPNSPVVDCILKYRGMKKLLGTYVNALPGLVNPLTGHIHSSFNQAVTATGRLSSSNPNLQNIPVRGDDGKEIRKAFVPEEGQLFFSADYSQIELRLMAHISGDANMIEAFVEGHDIHAATAAKIYHKDIADVTSDERRKAKTANFGIIYGISAFGLSQRLGISRSEAKELIDGYFATYPHIKDYIEAVKEKARTDGYVETVFKRRRYVPDINSHNAVVRGYAERNAVNAPIQGSASDIIKIAMVRIFDEFRARGIKSKMILQVHDELNFSVLSEEREVVQQIVKSQMEGAYQLKVPLKADCGWGENWLEAH
jgi:DNA polymerase I